MENQEKLPPTQRVALPAHLHQRLQAFRIGQVDHQTYVVRDKLLGKNYDFEPWQFFVLEVLPGCEDAPKLASVFQDRFGYPLPQAQVTELFGSVADAGLFNDAAATHPLLSRYAQKRYDEEDGKPRLRSFRQLGPEPGQSHIAPAPGAESAEPQTTAAAKPTAPGPEVVALDQILPPGIQDALDFDPRATRRIWLGVDPRPVLKLLVPLLRPLRYLLLLLPLPVIPAVYATVRFSDLILADMTRLLSNVNFFQQAAFGLFTVNLLVVLTSAAVAHNFRATVSKVGLAFVLGFLPRFTARISHVQQLTRHERIWIHAAPLLLRLTLFSTGVLVWQATRAVNQLSAQVGLALGSVALFGLLNSANPLAKGNGYQLLCAYANEANLRGKSYKLLLSKLRGESFKELDELLLATYALSTVLFMFGMIAAAVIVLGVGLHRIHLGGSAWIVMGTLAFVLTRRTLKYLGGVRTAYERAEQFERWKKRALPPEATLQQEKKRGLGSYLWHAVPLCVFGVLFVPYPYAAGGSFTISPALQQVISTDVSGVVREVHFTGGETLKKGTVIAKLGTAESEARLNVATAQMAEQRAVIDDLKSRPRYEDVNLASRALEVANARLEFNRSQFERIEKVYKEGVVSFEDYDRTRTDYQVALALVEEKKAELAVVRVGASKEQIAAAEAKFESLRAERDAYADELRRSELVMPFDGRILTLNLKEKGNSYYERGGIFAAAEMTGPVTAEIEVPESDMEYVTIGAKVHIRPRSRSSALLSGTIRTIDWNATERPFGNVIKIIAVMEPGADELRNGMTGYAKVDGPKLPVWQAFSLALTRFFMVEVWSWIP